MSKILNWGKCQPYTRKYNSDGSRGAAWVKYDFPVSESTSLETTEGEETAAKIEGGEKEAVRRTANEYALSFEVRAGANYTSPLDDTDGKVDGEFEVLLFPTENPTAPALYIPKASANTTDSYNSTDGSKVKYNFDALTNDLGFGQVIMGTAMVSGDAPTSFVAFKDSAKKNLLGD